MAEELKQLKAHRGVVKGQLTRCKNYHDNLNIAEMNTLNSW